ncbi:MAG: GNAT family N-acetyltransferase [Cyclobacteriaceae bacterium]
MSSTTEITLRHASIDDLELLECWDTHQHVIDSDPDDDWDWSNELKRFPEWREQHIAELNGRPIGFVQIIDPAKEESHYWGDVPNNLRAIDIWIGEKGDLGKGYGTIMMQLAIDRCFEDASVTAIIIDPLESNSKAIRFYERIGFQFVERRVLGSSNCSVYQLSPNQWQTKEL